MGTGPTTGQIGPAWTEHANESPAAAVPVKMSYLVDARTTQLVKHTRKTPAEKSQLLNVACLRELLASGAIYSLTCFTES
eukprot:5704076-Amphidinium_carterae.1